MKSMWELPNPFEFVDESLVSHPEDWGKRREELKTLAQFHVFGFVQKPESVSYTVNDTESDNLTVMMSQGDKKASFSATVHIPKYGVDTSTLGPYPVLIVIGFVFQPQVVEFLKHGYAVITMPTAPVYSDNAERSGAYTALFPYVAGDPKLDSGALMGWGWGVSRIIDVLDMGAFVDINPCQTIVTGVSRNGKAALLAAAFDERIAVAVPVDTGQAGASSFRYNVEGRIYHYPGNPFPEGMGRSEKISNMIGMKHWFSSEIAKFVDAEDQIPFDSHSIMALVAPRPLLIFAGEEFDWLCQPSTVLSYVATKEVYEFLGAQNVIGLNVRKGAHALQNRDVPILIDFSNHALRGTPYKLSKNNFPFTDTYNDYPYIPDSSYIPWTRPGKHTLLTKTEQILAGAPATVIVVSDAETVTVQPPSTWFSKADPITVPVIDGQAVVELTAEQAKEGNYTVTAAGPRDSRTIGFLGTRFDNALKTTFTQDGNSRILHFADRYDKASIRVLVNGEDITDVRDPEKYREEGNRQVYLMNYGMRFCNFEAWPKGKDGAFQIEIRNLKFKNFFSDQTFRYTFTVYAKQDNLVSSSGPVLLMSGVDSGFRQMERLC